MLRLIWIAALAAALLTAGAARAEPGSRQHFTHGQDRGSLHYLSYGNGAESLYYMLHGNGFGSAYYFQHGDKPGSHYYWRYGRDVGSDYYWRYGREPGSQYYWRYGRGCMSEYGWRYGPEPACDGIQRSQLHLLFMLCAAGLLEISVCREMLDAVEARQLQDAAGGRAVALLREIVAQANY